MTAVLLGTALVTTYRRSADACAADGTCTPAAGRRVKLLLWIVTIIVVVTAAFPGVKKADVSYEEGTAEVIYDASKITPDAIARAVSEKSGFKATVAAQPKP